MQDGKIKTCCGGLDVLGDINVDSIKSAITSDTLEDIKKNILSDVIPNNCLYCKQKEEKNLQSLRQVQYTTTTDIENLKIIDIRWNSICNLNCIYCDEEFSTTWQKIKNPSEKVIIKSDYVQDLLSWIKDKANSVEKLSLVGGEPLLMKQNFELLKIIPKETIISIITNLSVDIQKNPISLLLLGRSSTDWNVSLENFNKQFEYVRHGASYDLLECNMKHLVATGSHIRILMVYGIFSAFSIKETIQHYYNLGVTNFALTVVIRNDLLDIFYFPKEILIHAQRSMIDLINWASDKNIRLEGFTTILLKLNKQIIENKTSVVTKDNFIAYINDKDKYNKLKFVDCFPEVYDLIISELNKFSTNKNIHV